MSHRKFRAPRHGHLGFLPRKKCRRGRPRIKSFPKDNKKKSPHLTAFMGYKAGMTHITRDLDRPGSALNKKEISESVTIVETPPMAVVGIVGYRETPYGLRPLHTIWAEKLSETFLKKQVKNWFSSKKISFLRHYMEYNFPENQKRREEREIKIIKRCSIIRIIAHTLIDKLSWTEQKKAHVMEIQINGGKTMVEKMDFAVNLLEKYIPVDMVFKKDECIDVVGITKGKGFKGVISRYHTKRLPRKTHKGFRKVACIGAWHPSRVSYTVARAGQKGYHHRTEYSKKIYMVGKSINTPEGKICCKTEYDITEKGINPLGGFVNFGEIREDFLMIKGTVSGPSKRVLCLRKQCHPNLRKRAKEVTTLKFIDTASKVGNGKYQTIQEKRRFLGPMKKDLIKKRKEELLKTQQEREQKKDDEQKEQEGEKKETKKEEQKEKVKKKPPKKGVGSKKRKQPTPTTTTTTKQEKNKK